MTELGLFLLWPDSIENVEKWKERKTMNEYEELASKLSEKREKLLSVVIEAEAKIVEYTKALDEGRKHLRKVEALLDIFGK